MKSFIFTFMVTFTVLVSFASFIGSRPVYTSNPETGITCITVESIWSNQKIPAGCYLGDIHNPDVKLAVVATQKYQSTF